jgi:hypothetical protein
MNRDGGRRDDGRPGVVDQREEGDVMEFHKGDRVCFSETGKSELQPEHPSRLGTAAATKRPESICVAVIWDGQKSLRHYHESFIDNLSEPEQSVP